MCFYFLNHILIGLFHKINTTKKYVMDIHAQNQHSAELNENIQEQSLSKPEHQRSKKEFQVGNSNNHMKGNVDKKKHKETVIEKGIPKEHDPHKDKSILKKVSGDPYGLVDRQIGDGSEDLNDIDTDVDNELSTK